MEIIKAQDMYNMLTPTTKAKIKAIDVMIQAAAKEREDNVTVIINCDDHEYTDILKHFDEYGFAIRTNKCGEKNSRSVNLYWGTLDPTIEFKKEAEYLGYMDAFRMTVDARKNNEELFSHKYYLNHYLEDVTDVDFIISEYFISGSYLDSNSIDLITTMELMQEAGYAVYFDTEKKCIKYSCDPGKTSIKQKDIYDIYKEYFTAMSAVDFSAYWFLL